MDFVGKRLKSGGVDLKKGAGLGEAEAAFVGPQK